jgi:hypothetical protein
MIYRNLNIRISKTLILTVVLHGCETWSLILREEHRDQGAEEDVWTEGGRSDGRVQLLRNLYSSPGN